METQRKPAEKGNRGRHLRDAAEEKLARTPGAAPERKEKTPEELVHELRVHQIEFEMQNEELKKAQLALEVSRDKYVDLYDFAPVGFFTFTRGGRIAEVNLTGAALLGGERQELLNRGFGHFVAPEDLEQWERHLGSVLQQGKKQSCELVLKWEDGSTFHARLDSIRLDLPDGQEKAGVSGKTPVVRTAVSDITERKRAEETLRENKEKYRELVESISDVIYEIDERGKFTYVSPVTRNVLGYEPEDLVGRGFIEFVHPEDRDLLVRRFSELTQGIEYPLEYRVMAKSDEVRWVRTRTKPMMKGNAFSGGRGTLIDITERKRAEEALRRSEEEAKRIAQENAIVAEIGRIISSTLNIEEIYERFVGEMHKLIDFERVAMNIIDPEERTFIMPYVSGPQVADRRTGDVIPLAGTGTEEIMRTRSSLFILDKDWESVISRCPGLSPIFKAGFQSVMMVPLISKNDVVGVLNIQSTRPNAYTQTDLRVAERIGIQISGAIANAQLFSERKRAEEERERLLADLEAKNRELESFVYTISHDLKAPLVSLNGFSSVLQKKYESQLGEEGKHYLERIKANVAHMDALTTSLLELSRIGQVIGSIEEIDVAALLREVRVALAVRLKEAGAEFVVQGPLPTVCADRGRIHQVFVNLIDNAVKFRSAERALRIEVGCRQESGFYRFHVADNGIGIAPQYHEQIFTPFRKMHPEIEGVGIGLALVKKIVEHHGGRVCVESEAGKGSTFYFTIPKGITKDERR